MNSLLVILIYVIQRKGNDEIGREAELVKLT